MTLEVEGWARPRGLAHAAHMFARPWGIALHIRNLLQVSGLGGQNPSTVRVSGPVILAEIERI